MFKKIIIAILLLAILVLLVILCIKKCKEYFIPNPNPNPNTNSNTNQLINIPVTAYIVKKEIKWKDSSDTTRLILNNYITKDAVLELFKHVSNFFTKLNIKLIVNVKEYDYIDYDNGHSLNRLKTIARDDDIKDYSDSEYNDNMRDDLYKEFIQEYVRNTINIYFVSFTGNRRQGNAGIGGPDLIDRTELSDYCDKRYIPMIILGTWTNKETIPSDRYDRKPYNNIPEKRIKYSEGKFEIERHTDGNNTFIRTVIHELCHIFGLPHEEEETTINIMGGGYSLNINNTQIETVIKTAENLNTYFNTCIFKSENSNYDSYYTNKCLTSVPKICPVNTSVNKRIITDIQNILYNKLYDNMYINTNDLFQKTFGILDLFNQQILISIKYYDIWLNNIKKVISIFNLNNRDVYKSLSFNIKEYDHDAYSFILKLDIDNMSECIDQYYVYKLCNSQLSELQTMLKNNPISTIIKHNNQKQNFLPFFITMNVTHKNSSYFSDDNSKFILNIKNDPILVTKLPYWFNNPRDSLDAGTKIDSLLRDIYIRMKFIYISPNEEINKLTIFDFDNNQLFIDKNYFNNFLFMNKDYKNINILLFAQTKRGINKPLLKISMNDPYFGSDYKNYIYKLSQKNLIDIKRKIVKFTKNDRRLNKIFITANAIDNDNKIMNNVLNKLKNPITLQINKLLNINNLDCKVNDPPECRSLTPETCSNKMYSTDDNIITTLKEYCPFTCGACSKESSKRTESLNTNIYKNFKGEDYLCNQKSDHPDCLKFKDHENACKDNYELKTPEQLKCPILCHTCRK